MLDFNRCRGQARYERAAQNAIRTCLRVQPGEHVTLITDQDTLPIAASLYDELKLGVANVHTFVVEDYAERPMLHMPKEILDDLEQAQVSIYCMQGQTGELTTRKEIFREAEPSIRKPTRSGHAMSVDQGASAALAHDPCELPQLLPECLAVGQRPGIERGVVW